MIRKAGVILITSRALSRHPALTSPPRQVFINIDVSSLLGNAGSGLTGLDIETAT